MQRMRMAALNALRPGATPPLSGLQAQQGQQMPQTGFVQRLQWSMTHTLLAPEPEEHLLEINCTSNAALAALEDSGNYPNAITVSGDLESLGMLPLPDVMFDKVVIMNTVEFSMYPEAFLREVRRVLKPGGRLVAQVPSLSYREATADVLGLYRETFGAQDVYTRSSAESRLREVGFVITDWLYLFNSPLSHRLFTWAMRRQPEASQEGPHRARGLYRLLSPLAYHLCRLSDRMAGRPNEGHFLIIQAAARPQDLTAARPAARPELVGRVAGSEAAR